MDIQNIIEPEQPNLTQNSGHRSTSAPAGTTKSDDSTETGSYQLPPHISKVLDELEKEEELELQNRPTEETEPRESDDEPTTEEFITPEDIGQELDKALNLAERESYCSKQDDQDLKEWGKTGLDGLKNIFKRSSPSLSIPSTSQKVGQSSADLNPPACPTPPTSIMATSTRTDKLSSQDETGSSAKPPPKKSVTFAPETYLNPPKSPPTSSSPAPPNPPRPSPGIMLSDIVERPIAQPGIIPPIKPTQPSKIEVNGKNAYLNPRLASLLPRALKSKPEDPGSQQEEEEEEESADEDDPDDSNDDEANDGSSVWSVDDEEAEGGSSWPPEDQHIETALDLRQAAIEYHTKRQGLGLGRGTGPLGGDRAPGSDEEAEWVPLDARAQAPGVPRRSNGQSRFKTGRPLHLLDPDALGEHKVVDGKLFGAAPIIEGPAPTMGAAVHQLPGRPADFSELDDELTAEEVELLRSRLEALGMDEERRIAAERAGSELMAWMEKARSGQINLEDEDYGPQPPLDTAPQHAHDLLPEEPSVERASRNEGPPEIKTAPKTSALKSRAAISKNPSPTTVQPDAQTTSQQQPNYSIKSIHESTESIPEDSPPIPKKVSRFKASKIYHNL
ncbi:hypothetical protein PtB15_6B851 [Puccinia triticina]|nr:hypothetical protein PtB15_6B851 [Puccinia triticina]